MAWVCGTAAITELTAADGPRHGVAGCDAKGHARAHQLEKGHDVLLFLVHHGAAMDPQVEAQRPLSAEGHRTSELLARLAASRGVKPAHVWHSGKLRAKQTAEYYWRHCNALASFKVARGLQPTDDPAYVRAILVEAGDVPLMVVGHYPNLPAVYHLLTTGSADVTGGTIDVLPFPQHGLVALESIEAHRLWRESFRLTASEVA